MVALLGLAFYGDLREVGARLAGFDLRLLAPVLALSGVNYALRWARWEMYLRALGVRLSPLDSLSVLLVGFVLSLTPGKAGELGKAWLVRELGGGPARHVVPAVLGERLTDVLGIVLLVALGSLPLPGGPWIAAAALAVVVLLAGLVAWRRGARWAIGLFRRVPWTRRHAVALEEIHDRLRSLLGPGLLAAGLGLSALAWGAEGIGFLVVVRGHGDGAAAFGPLAALFDYSVATLAGALSMLPGGLVASEGSLVALLDLQGLDASAAASATLITRAATLWFAVALGLVALPRVVRRIRRQSAKSSAQRSTT